MKGILEFDLPEERTEFEQAQDGWRWENVIWEFTEQYLRPIWKHGQGPEVEWAEKARAEIYRLMEDTGVNFDD